MSANNKTLGSLEKVTFPQFGGLKEIAKIDTGAYTGALHCTKIRIETTTEGKVLHFSPFDHPEIELSVNKFSRRTVTSSFGRHQTRYFVKTTIVIKGDEYPITLSLADRSELTRMVLIGRKFLKENNFLVDVTKKP